MQTVHCCWKPLVAGSDTTETMAFDGFAGMYDAGISVKLALGLYVLSML